MLESVEINILNGQIYFWGLINLKEEKTWWS